MGGFLLNSTRKIKYFIQILRLKNSRLQIRLLKLILKLIKDNFPRKQSPPQFLRNQTHYTTEMLRNIILAALSAYYGNAEQDLALKKLLDESSERQLESVDQLESTGRELRRIELLIDCDSHIHNCDHLA